jgi:hypothetical protein
VGSGSVQGYMEIYGEASYRENLTPAAERGRNGRFKNK